ncbi:MAG: hypothetical protein AAF518_15915 [Spirochaetota bacterium]
MKNQDMIKFHTRKIEKFVKAISGYSVLKFYEIEEIPLISLRNLDNKGHCKESFAYFYNRLAEESNESLEEKSIDLALYQKICADIKGKLFLTIGYTTDTDTSMIEKENGDCDHLLYFWTTDVAWSFHYYESTVGNGNPSICTREYLKKETVNFRNQESPPF